MNYAYQAAVRLKGEVFVDDMHAWALDAAINKFCRSIEEREALTAAIDSDKESLEFGYFDEEYSADGFVDVASSEERKFWYVKRAA